MIFYSNMIFRFFILFYFILFYFIFFNLFCLFARSESRIWRCQFSFHVFYFFFLSLRCLCVFDNVWGEGFSNGWEANTIYATHNTDTTHYTTLTQHSMQHTTQHTTLTQNTAQHTTQHWHNTECNTQQWHNTETTTCYTKSTIKLIRSTEIDKNFWSTYTHH